MTHPSGTWLEEHLDHLRSAPTDIGTLELVVRRPAERVREVLDEATLHTEVGLVGDNWRKRGSRRTSDGSAHPDMQLTVMSHRMISLLADTPGSRALAGDQLYVDLDLSRANLPAGSRLSVGSQAVIEVTPVPHGGCAKFVRRFGPEAMRFVNGSSGREMRLRGLNARVVVGGCVRPGDKVSRL